jgi:hypothetical protein
MGMGGPGEGFHASVQDGLYGSGNEGETLKGRGSTYMQQPRQGFGLPLTRPPPPFSGLDVVPDCAHDCAREGL